MVSPYRRIAVLGTSVWLTACGASGSLPACSLPEGVPADARVVSSLACDGGGRGVFSAIGAALTDAPPGGTVVVTAGTWREAVVLDRDVSLVGSGAATTIISPPPSASGVRVKGAVAVRVSNLSVEKATAAGIRVDGGELTLQDVDVRATSKTAFNASPDPLDLPRPAELDEGHGVQVVEGASLKISGGRIEGNQGVGIYISGGRAIIDPTFLVANGSGGIAIIDPTFHEGDTVSVTGATLDGNSLVGVALYGEARATLSGVSVTGTLERSGEGGDGLLVVDAANLEVDSASSVEGSARAGVLASGSSSVTFGGASNGNGLAGLWAQLGASATVVGSALLDANQVYGLAATSGSTLTVDGATVSGTTGAADSPGDAVLAASGAALTITGATLSGNARAGIFADSPSPQTFTVTDVSVTGSQHGLVLQNQPDGAAWETPTASSFTAQKVSGDSILLDAGLGFRASVCASGDCIPR